MIVKAEELYLLRKIDDLLKDFRNETGQLMGVQVDFDRGSVAGEVVYLEGKGYYHPMGDSSNKIRLYSEDGQRIRKLDEEIANRET